MRAAWVERPSAAAHDLGAQGKVTVRNTVREGRDAQGHDDSVALASHRSAAQPENVAAPVRYGPPRSPAPVFRRGEPTAPRVGRGSLRMGGAAGRSAVRRVPSLEPRRAAPRRLPPHWWTTPVHARTRGAGQRPLPRGSRHTTAEPALRASRAGMPLRSANRRMTRAPGPTGRGPGTRVGRDRLRAAPARIRNPFSSSVRGEALEVPMGGGRAAPRREATSAAGSTSRSSSNISRMSIARSAGAFRCVRPVFP